MAKNITRVVTIAIEAGKATAAPPVGTAVGPLGINIQEFCTKYNEATRDKMGDIIPVELTVYEDRTFDIKLKTPPTAFLIKKVAGIKKGSATGSKENVGSLTQAQVREIAEIKLPDLNAYDIDAAMKIVAGTAANMGVKVED